MSPSALLWHAKAFGPGDIDGTGTQRLLGQPDLDLVDLLVRETAQNSWDARLGGQEPPAFEVRLRTLSPLQVHVLRSTVLVETGPTGGLGHLLHQPRMEVIEIVDRATKGLGGALRIDEENDGPRDWINFVLAVGAPPSANSTAGGTYGFGKTASYLASSVSTILIWTATHHEARIQHRFIGSAINEAFTLDGRRYTGRQWWGREPGAGGAEHPIEPAVGDEARSLGESLFERGFDEGETGTSILILAPKPPPKLDPDDDGPDPTWAERLPESIIRNLWPKLIPNQGADRTMVIRIFDHGAPVSIPDSSQSPTLGALERCLEKARVGDDEASDPYLKCDEIWAWRPRVQLGRLALTRFTPQPNDPLADLTESITLMRSPELVVRAQLHPSPRKVAMAWVGVFRPLDQHDRAFAAAEPPAHDQWEPQSVLEKSDRRIVNLALKRIKEHTTEFLTPKMVDDSLTRAEPTAALAARLASLSGTALGSRPTPGSGRKGRPSSEEGSGGGRRRSDCKVSVTKAILLPRTNADLAQRREQTRFEFSVNGVSSAGATVSAARMRIVIEGGSVPGEDDIRLERWWGPSGEDLGPGTSIRVSSDTTGAVDVSSWVGVALDFELKAEPT